MSFKTAGIIIYLFCISIVIASTIPVSSDKQLFIDDKFIDSCDRITINSNVPSKFSIAIKTDQKWESSGIYGSSVVQDGNLIRLYYRAIEFDKPNTWGKRRICYAQSIDGINWSKPSLGQVEYAGSKDNNILDLEDLGYVFIDSTATLEKRYKMIAASGLISDVNNCGMYL